MQASAGFYLNEGDKKKKSDQDFHEKFLNAAEEEKLSICVVMLLIRILVLRFVKGVGVGHDGPIGKLMDMKIHCLVDHHQSHGENEQPGESPYCYFLNNIFHALRK